MGVADTAGFKGKTGAPVYSLPVHSSRGQCHGHRRGRPSQCIIFGFPAQIRNMEAEQLNAIANKLADLETRSAELRRYL